MIAPREILNDSARPATRISVDGNFVVSTSVAESALPLSNRVLVLGGNINACAAAAALAERGREVTLVVTEEDLLHDTLSACQALAEVLLGVDPPAAPQEAIAERVRRDLNITILRQAEIQSVAGAAGDFQVDLCVAGARHKISVGAILNATCDLAPRVPCTTAVDSKTNGHTRIVPIAGVIEHLHHQASVPRRIAILLDVHEEQGRLSTVLGLALARKLLDLDADCVRVYSRNLRTGGTGIESLYRQARAQGVEFLRYTGTPELTGAGAQVVLTARDAQLGSVITDRFDLVVSGDFENSPTACAIATLLGIRQVRGALADNIWAVPCETNRRGIYLLGNWGGNRDFQEMAHERTMAAAAVDRFLGPNQALVKEDAAAVDPEKCVACLTCLRLCPHGAISFSRVDEAASIANIMCRRCGVCVAECPANAISLGAQTTEDVRNQILPKRALTVFACANSGAEAARQAAESEPSAANGLQLISVPCAGRIDPCDILHAFEQGAERVLVLSCNPESCRFFDGAGRSQRRVKRLQDLLASAGIDPERLAWNALIASETGRFSQLVSQQPPLNLETRS